MKIQMEELHDFRVVLKRKNLETTDDCEGVVALVESKGWLSRSAEEGKHHYKIEGET